MKKVDFQVQVLKLLSGINKVVNTGMQGKTPFQIFKRETRKKLAGRPVYIYYVQFLDERTGKYKTAKSSGQSSRAAAFQWAMAQLREAQQPSEITWKDFTKGIFDPESNFLSHHAKRGKVIGEVHRQHHHAYLVKYIEPYFGKLKISKTSADDIEGFQNWLLKQPVLTGIKGTPAKDVKTGTPRLLTASTALKIMSTFRILIKWALKKKAIMQDPLVAVDPLVATQKRRGILTHEEIRRLFSVTNNPWTDARLRVLSLVAVTSGLRAGELQGLLRESVKEIIDAQGRPAGLLTVTKSWSRTRELKAPKNGKPRITVIPHFVYSELQALMTGSPYQNPTDFVFYQVDRNLPVSHQIIFEHFIKALAAIGISEAERQERNLVFHSFRHAANSNFVDAGVPVMKVQAMIGHNSEAMTANYLHVGQDFSDVLAASEKFFEKS